MWRGAADGYDAGASVPVRGRRAPSQVLAAGSCQGTTPPGDPYVPDRRCSGSVHVGSVHVAVIVRSHEEDGRADVGQRFTGGRNEESAGTDRAVAEKSVS